MVLEYKKSAMKTSAADLTTVPQNPVYDEAVSQDRGANVQLTTNEASKL